MRNWLCCLKSYCYCCSVKLCLTLLWCYGLELARLLYEWDFSDKNTGMGCISFSRESSQTRDWSNVSWLAGRFFTIESQVKLHLYIYIYYCYYHCHYYLGAMDILSFIIDCTLKYSSKWNTLISIFSWHNMYKKRCKLCN